MNCNITSKSASFKSYKVNGFPKISNSYLVVKHLIGIIPKKDHKTSHKVAWMCQVNVLSDTPGYT